MVSGNLDSVKCLMRWETLSNSLSLDLTYIIISITIPILHVLFVISTHISLASASFFPNWPSEPHTSLVYALVTRSSYAAATK